MKAIVIGAGIGGTTAALALLRRGIEVELYEQAPKLLPLGAGIGLWGNAISCLDELGLGDAVLGAGTLMETAEIRTKAGRVLGRSSLGEVARRLGRPAVCVRRGVLHDILVGALPAGVLRLGHELEGFSDDGSGVTARFMNGHEARGEVLIGADGLRSKVRRQVLGDGLPRYSGYGGWLGVAEFSHPLLPPGLVVESWGRGERFGMLCCGPGHAYWFAAMNRAEPVPTARPGKKEELLRFARGWHEPYPQLAEATEEGHITELSYWDREPVSRWGEGRVTLLGDAAHPMTPNIGQGACQAIEDGLLLAGLLGGGTAAEQVLREYEARRSRRTAKLVRAARRFGAFAQRSDALSVGLRDLVFRLVPARVQVRQMAAMFARPGVR